MYQSIEGGLYYKSELIECKNNILSRFNYLCPSSNDKTHGMATMFKWRQG